MISITYNNPTSAIIVSSIYERFTNKSILSIDGTLTSTITSSGLGSNSIETLSNSHQVFGQGS